MIGCDCAVCKSPDPRDQRLRTSILISIDDKNIGVDAGPDFRQQMLRAGVTDLEAILVTHQHNDHIIGLDDVRPFNFKHRKSIPIYATELVQEELKKRFSYAFDLDPYPGAPRLELVQIDKDTPIKLAGEKIIPIEVLHGELPVMGFRLRDFTYLTDMNAISEAELQKVLGSKTLVLDALHHSEHHSHFNLAQAVELATTIAADTTYFIHASHRMGLHAEIEKDLPTGMHLAYDRLSFSI
ncbi:MAG: MBL fold metallo-hydrolase [Saprospiraceae bacterium]